MNNESIHFRDWDSKKLTEFYQYLYSSIYENECFGVRDLKMFAGASKELKARGIKPKTNLEFSRGAYDN